MDYVMQRLNSSKGTQQMRCILSRLVITVTKDKEEKKKKNKPKMFAVISKWPLVLV